MTKRRQTIYIICQLVKQHHTSNEYRNLSKCSNQGQEALNLSTKCAMNKGGSGGKGEHIKTKLRAIALWLQRKIFWTLFDFELLFQLSQIS